MEPAQTVSPAEAASALSQLQELPGTDQDGFFGPGSMLWRVNREAGLFLGAGRAALLQLAHPWVAAAIEQHSTLKSDPIGRFHSTFRVIYTMAFGTRTQALSAARRLYRRHTGIRGELPSTLGAYPAGQHYEANEISALLWVFATLADTAILAYDTVLPPLSEPEKEAYYAEFQRMGTLFGIPPAALPPSWTAFQAYLQERFQSGDLLVDAGGRALGQSVLGGVGSWVRPPHWYRALTTAWLPADLRDGFGLPFASTERQAVEYAQRWLPPLYRGVPSPLRFVGPYHEAQARLAGRSAPWWVRRSNRFWMGQPTMLHATPASDPVPGR